MKNLTVILLTLASLPIFGAERPPQPQRLPTFLEMVKKEEERQAKELEERRQAIEKKKRKSKEEKS